MLIITTAGSNRAYPCYAFRNRCIEVLQSSVSKDEKHKVKRQEDLFAIIYTLNKEDDWKSEDTWIKCNPSWDIMNQIEFRDEAKTAMEFESDQIGFQNLRLNIWTDAEHVWIKDDDWMKCAGPVKTDEELKDIPCYGGIDFASSKDLNALVLNFPLSDGTRHIKCWFWIPQKKVFEKEDYVDYDVWRKQGLINVIPGDAVNHEDLAAEVLRILQRFNVIGLAYDPYGIGEATIQTMINQGFPVEKLDKWAQRTSEYQRPIRTLEEEIHLQRINHEGHPVLRWNLHNIVLFMDSYGGVKFNKSKVVDKIDGMVALAMAIGEEMSQPEEDQGNFYVL
jgi:phage terminase large subunit-like protein